MIFLRIKNKDANTARVPLEDLVHLRAAQLIQPVNLPTLHWTPLESSVCEFRSNTDPIKHVMSKAQKLAQQF
jgi:hypothetical protein